MNAFELFTKIKKTNEISVKDERTQKELTIKINECVYEQMQERKEMKIKTTYIYSRKGRINEVKNQEITIDIKKHNTLDNVCCEIIRKSLCNIFDKKYKIFQYKNTIDFIQYILFARKIQQKHRSQVQFI